MTRVKEGLQPNALMRNLPRALSILHKAINSNEVPNAEANTVANSKYETFKRLVQLQVNYARVSLQKEHKYFSERVAVNVWQN